MATPHPSSPSALRQLRHQQQQQTQPHPWTAPPPQFQNKDTIHIDNLFTDPFPDSLTPLSNPRDPLPFSLAPSAQPPNTINIAPTAAQPPPPPLPPPQHQSQPQQPQPQPQPQPQHHHQQQQTWTDPSLNPTLNPQQPQISLTRTHFQALTPSHLQSQLPNQPTLQQLQLQQPPPNLQQSPTLHQPATTLHQNPPPNVLRQLQLQSDALSPTQRRQIRIQLRRTRQRTRRLQAPPRPERPSMPVPVTRSDNRPAAMDKKAARVIRNREVALKARQAAKTKMKNLEEENSSLKNRATTLEVENSTLKSQIEMLRKGGGAGGGVPWEGDMAIGGVVNAMTN